MASELLEQSETEYYEFLFEQYQKGVKSGMMLLNEASISLLRAKGYISSNSKTVKKQTTENVLYNWLDSKISEYRDIKDVTVEQWKPNSVIFHTPEFYRWIDTIIYGSSFNFVINRIKYKPYELYKAQAFQYISDGNDPSNYLFDDSRDNSLEKEYNKCRDNTLYFAMKYGFVKEGSDSAGRIQYIPKEHNMFLFFLLDCGYSLIIGKPRQIFASTTIGLFALKKILLQSNFFIKFIAEDDKTVQSIFTDRIKYPFSELPSWLQPNVISDSADNFWFGQKIKKGTVEPPNSRIKVVCPSITAINSESPQLVLIDEIASIPMLTEMLLETLPTLFIDKNQNGNLEFRRQIVMWSSGVYGDKGKNHFEHEWNRILGLFGERNTNVGFVPIFLCWDTRCNHKHYLNQKEVYYGGKNLVDTGAFDIETNKKIFAMHYPSTFNDMFLKSSNTLVPRQLIDEGIGLIKSMPHELRPVAGYFEPVYDKSMPYLNNSEIPYKIVDAIFVPCNDDEMELATAWRLLPPNKEWINRYYQGTDPIAVETGHSKFSSVIFDKYENIKAPTCILNFRKQYDHRYSFLQCVLMGLYYDTNKTEKHKEGVPELVESNIGGNYIDFKDLTLGFGRNMVYRTQLPEKLRTGKGTVGVDNHGSKDGTRGSYIIDKMRECVKSNYKNIKFPVVFEQLQTFVRKQKIVNESWEALDKNINYDDVLFALVYSYICSEYVFDYVVPKKISSDNKERTILRYERYRENDGSITRVQKRVANY